MSGFTRATKTTAKARIGLYGVSGSGKTMHGLGIARVLAGPGGKIALLDTEGGSASKYADLFEFDSNEMRKPFHPERFAKCLDAAVKAGYDVLIADGISPFWNGEGGTLSIVDAAKKRGGGWADGSKENDKLIEAILTSPIHLVVTVRAKADVAVENVNGKVTYRKVGIKMIQRDELDYELDVLLYLDLDNSATVEKSRKPDELGRLISRDDVPEWAVGFKGWLDTGTPADPANALVTLAKDVLDASEAATYEGAEELPFEVAAPATGEAESQLATGQTAAAPAVVPPVGGGRLIESVNDAASVIRAMSDPQLVALKTLLDVKGVITKTGLAARLYDQRAGWCAEDVHRDLEGLQ
jgi:hypothetical protein